MYNISTRKYTGEDYETVCSWWNEYPLWDCVPNKHLPRGYIALDRGQPVAVTFYYVDPTCKFAMLAYPTTNPQARLGARMLGLVETIQAIKSDVRDMFNDEGYIYGVVSQSSLKSVYAKCGMRVAEGMENATSMFYQLGEQHNETRFL